MQSPREDTPLTRGSASCSPPASLNPAQRSKNKVARAKARRLHKTGHVDTQGLDKVLEEMENDEKESFRSVVITLGIVAVTILGGALMLSLLEDWSFYDSIYFCIVTMTTVGYGDITPQRPISKLFVIVYVVVSIGVLSTLLANMVGSLLDQQEALMLAAMFGDDSDDEGGSQDQTDGGETGVSLRPPSVQRSMTQRIFQYTTGLDWSDYCALGVSVVYLMGILVIGMLIFILMEGLSVVDALYTTVISASTVGFGDFEPTMAATKLMMTVWLVVATVCVVKVIADFTDASVKIKQKAMSRRMLTAQLDINTWKTMDKDGDGTVDKAEFLAELLVRTGKVEMEEVDAILARFDQLDYDKSGQLDLKEVTAT